MIEPMDSRQLETIESDTPCRPCGYNLRGLSPWGKCPECGNDVQHTLRLIRLEAADLRFTIHQADPKAIDEWIEGLWCVILWFTANLVGNFDIPHNPKLQLALCVSAWTIGCLGIWKIAHPGNSSIRPDRLALALRVLLVIGALFPLAWGVENLPPRLSPGIEVYILLLGTLAAAMLLNYRLGHISAMLSSISLKVQFYFFAAFIPWFGFAIEASFLAGSDITRSLDLMRLLPSPAFVATLWVTLNFSRMDPGTLLLACVMAITSCWPIALHILLLIKLVRAREQLQQNSTPE